MIKASEIEYVLGISQNSGSNFSHKAFQLYMYRYRDYRYKNTGLSLITSII